MKKTKNLKKKNQSIHKLDTFYDSILNEMVHGIWVCDKKNIIYYTNRIMGKIAGIPKEQILNNNVLKDFPEKTIKQFKPYFIKAKKNLKPVYYEAVSVFSPAGRQTYQSGWLMPKIENGKYNGMICTVEDVTDKVLSEKRLEETEKKAKKYLDIAAIIILALNAKGEVTLINKKGCSVLGYDEKEIIGKNWFETFLPQRYRKEVRGVAEKLWSGEMKTVEYYENPILTKNGEERIIAWHNTILTDESKKITGLLSSGEDITENKKIEQERIKTENELRKFKFISDNSNEANFLVDKYANFLYVNKIACERMGYSEEELLKKKVPDVDIIFTMKKYKKLFSMIHKERVPPFETINKRKDGTLFPSEISSSGVILDDVPYMFATLRDISERKKAEEMLYKSEERFRSLYESSIDGITLCELDGKLLDANEAFLKMLGYKLDELKKKKYNDITPVKWHKLEQKYLKKLDKKPYSVQYEKEYIRKNGDIINTNIRINTIFDKHGKKTGRWALIRDITDKIKAENALKASAKEWNTTFDSINDIVFLLNLDSRIVRCNKACNDFFNKTSKEIIGRTCYEVIHGQKGHIYDCPFKRVLKTLKRETLIFEYDNRWFNVIVDPIFNENHKLTGAVHTMADITSIKHAEEELKKAYLEMQEMQNELIQSEKMAAFGKYSSGIAHEIKNPLANIKAAAQFCLENYKLDKDLSEYLKIVLRNSENAIKIIRESLSFAKPTEMLFNSERIENVIDRVCDLVLLKTKEKKIKIIRNLSEDIPNIILDKKRIEEAFMNIILNAVDAMKEGGELKIESYIENEDVIVRFKDTGKGIKKNDLEKIFEPFYTTKRDGIGLGLATANQIVKYHKGEIRVKSKEGKGTEFEIRLPIKD